MYQNRLMAKKSEKTLLDWALDYYQFNWSIIPIGFGKKPPKGFKWKKYQKTRPTEPELRQWFGNGGYKSFAVICGAVSGGLAVLDLDSEQRCDWWRRERPKSTENLPMVKTKNGQHIYFRSEPFQKRNGDNVDLLCEGAYAILPPSPNKEWIIPLNGELPLLNPFEWGLEQFNIRKPETQLRVTEDTEDTEEPEDLEDTDDTERHRSHRGGSENWLDYLDDKIKKEVENAIEHTLPKKKGQRNDAVFPLCQWLKALPELRNLPAKELKPIVKEWHKRAYPVIGTKNFTVTWADFIHAWSRVKWPKGDVMLSQAVKKALEGKTVLPEIDEYDTEEARLLLKVCYELQQGMGDSPFFLASRKAGGIIGLSHRAAFKLLEMFVADGKLELVQTHTTRKAPRYRYIAN